MMFFHFNEDAFQASQRTVFDANTLARCRVFPRFSDRAILKDEADGLHLARFEGYGSSSESNDSHNARRGQDGYTALSGVEAAKHIARKEREFYFGDALGPLPPGNIGREEFGKAF